jgi:hypothetical protein
MHFFQLQLVFFCVHAHTHVVPAVDLRVDYLTIRAVCLSVFVFVHLRRAFDLFLPMISFCVCSEFPNVIR